MRATDLRRFVGVTALALVTGCASTAGRAMRLSGQEALAFGEFTRAVKQASKYIDKAKSPSERFRGRLVALRALGPVSAAGSDITSGDEVALEHYNAALEYAADDFAKRAQLELARAEFFTSTYRGRQGLTHLQSADRFSRKATRVDLQIETFHAMTALFSTLGELELEADYRAATIELGSRAVGPKPEAGAVLDAYMEFLSWDLRDALGDRYPEHRLAQTWPQLEKGLDPMVSRVKAYWSVRRSGRVNVFRRFRITLDTAIVFSLRGNDAGARKLLERAVDDFVVAGGASGGIFQGGNADHKAICTRAQIEFNLGASKNAANLADECIANAETDGARADVEWRYRGLLAKIKEGAGELQAADELYRLELLRVEKIRASVPLEERTAYFRGPGREPWEGIVRVRTRQYTEMPSEQRLVALIEATDGMRARQLREFAGAGDLRAPNLSTIRQRLGTDGVLLTYTMAGDRVVLVALTATDTVVTTLWVTPKDLNGLLAALTRTISTGSPGALTRAEDDLAGLGSTLLGPAGPLLKGKSRVAVIADGNIPSFPFELLRIDGVRLRTRASVAYSPSLSFFERAGTRSGAETLYAVGDPQYAKAPKAVGYLRGVSTDRGSSLRGMFKPLPETRSEINAISKLFPERASFVALGGSATESHVKANPPTGYGYVHFATHGFLAGQVPGLAEPALLLGDEPGQDGFLTASEVAALKLNAELAVLSACSTGAGESLPGEGVMGMGRAFLVAGARGVVVSLWSVDSAATEALMVLFYAYHRAGVDPGRALHLAKRDIAAVPQWKHPYFWSAFVLVSEGGLLAPTGDPSAAEVTVGEYVASAFAPKSERGVDYEAPSFADDYSIQRPFVGPPRATKTKHSGEVENSSEVENPFGAPAETTKQSNSEVEDPFGSPTTKQSNSEVEDPFGD